MEVPLTDWGGVKKEVKKEPESDEDEFYDAEEYFGSSWLTTDCPELPEALKPYIREMSTHMEDLVILEEDHSRPEAQRLGCLRSNAFIFTGTPWRKLLQPGCSAQYSEC